MGQQIAGLFEALHSVRQTGRHVNGIIRRQSVGSSFHGNFAVSLQNGNRFAAFVRVIRQASPGLEAGQAGAEPVGAKVRVGKENNRHSLGQFQRWRAGSLSDAFQT